MFKYKVGQVVKHRSMLGRLIVIARVTVDSGADLIEYAYRCRNQYGSLQEFLEYELEEESKELLNG